MISQKELPDLIQKNIPEFTELLNKKNCRNAYDTIRTLFEHAKTQMKQKNFAMVRSTLLFAEQLYQQGNSAIKNAIENVFVYSFSQGFFYDLNKRKEVMQLMPVSLYEVYKKQVLSSHL
jgi:hypothetical protein